MIHWGKLLAMVAIVGTAAQEWKFDPMTGKKIKRRAPATSADQQRADVVWGRLYLDGAVDGLQYLKGSFGEKNMPTGLHDVVLADPLNACDMKDFEEGEDSPYTGKIVYAQRGGCTFEAKAIALDAAGASAMVVGNNDAGIAHMPGSQDLQLDMASIMVNNNTGVLLETLVRDKRGSSADGTVSTAIIPISCGTRADLHKLGLWADLDGDSDGIYECLTPVEKEREFMEIIQGGTLAVEGIEIEYLTASFGGPSLGQEYPFFVSDSSACESISEEAAGKIVIVPRGSCELLKKAELVQAAGAVAMVLVNDGPGIARMSAASQWQSAHILIHAVMTNQASGDKLIAAVKATADLKGQFQGGRIKESDWKEVVDLMKVDQWPTSKRKGKALYQTLSEKYSGNPDRMACLNTGWEAFKDDRGMKEEL